MIIKMFEASHYIRQTGLIDPEKLTNPILVIGAGNIGSWTALALMKLGCQDVTVIDHDIVEIHNVGSQLYNASDEGEPKVEAMRKRISLLADNSPQVLQERWTRDFNLSRFSIIISAVDSIAVRKEIFESLRPTNEFFIDGRMAGNSFTIYCIPKSDNERAELYKKTLFSPQEALPIPCSEQAVVYNCFVIAGLITDVVAQISNGKIPPVELEVDLINFMMMGGLGR